ncbi:C-myc promoter-binding protein [Plakobranchus ocellatus]|uniref:C-myc promoter-binding protein n=1 Tax=Plakobranchus ocellatus TaxID=259542 RepID=A0AAV4DPZ8_9GAST|nr:C-myc promoter-binding protein [Plakobranchus ocellatus]
MYRRSKAEAAQPPSKHDEVSERTSSKASERKIILTNCTLTCIGVALAFYALYFYVPIPTPSLPTVAHRLIYTLWLQTPAFLILGASVQYVATIRLYTPALDPINGGGERFVLFANRFLTNTVEQILLNVPAQLVLATFLKETEMKLIPILALMFVFGRITFFIGYKMSYMKRTLGFVSTFFVTMSVWLVNAYFVSKAILGNEPIQL